MGNASYLGNTVMPVVMDAYEAAALEGQYVHDKPTLLSALDKYVVYPEVSRYIESMGDDEVENFIQTFIRVSHRFARLEPTRWFVAQEGTSEPATEQETTPEMEAYNKMRKAPTAWGDASEKINPEMQQRLGAMYTDLENQGVEVIMTYGYRNIHQQAFIYGRGKRFPGNTVSPVGRPWTSSHTPGYAVDIRPVEETQENWQKMWDASRKAGLSPSGGSDPPHIFYHPEGQRAGELRPEDAEWIDHYKELMGSKYWDWDSESETFVSTSSMISPDDAYEMSLASLSPQGVPSASGAPHEWFPGEGPTPSGYQDFSARTEKFEASVAPLEVVEAPEVTVPEIAKAPAEAPTITAPPPVEYDIDIGGLKSPRLTGPRTTPIEISPGEQAWMKEVSTPVESPVGATYMPEMSGILDIPGETLVIPPPPPAPEPVAEAPGAPAPSIEAPETTVPQVAPSAPATEVELPPSLIYEPVTIPGVRPAPSPEAPELPPPPEGSPFYEPPTTPPPPSPGISRMQPGAEDVYQEAEPFWQEAPPEVVEEFFAPEPAAPAAPPPAPSGPVRIRPGAEPGGAMWQEPTEPTMGLPEIELPEPAPFSQEPAPAPLEVLPPEGPMSTPEGPVEPPPIELVIPEERRVEGVKQIAEEAMNQMIRMASDLDPSLRPTKNLEIGTGTKVQTTRGKTVKNRGGGKYHIPEGSSGEIIQDVFGDGTRFKVRIDGGGVAEFNRGDLSKTATVSTLLQEIERLASHGATTGDVVFHLLRRRADRKAIQAVLDNAERLGIL